MSISGDSLDQTISPSLEGEDVAALLEDEVQRGGRDDAEAKKRVNEENKRLDKKDRRHELIVAVVLLVVSILDAVLFMFINNWSAPLVVGTIQLLAALIFAKNYGVEEIQVWLNKLIDRLPTNGSGKGSK